MFSAILIMALSADPGFVPTPEFLEMWKSMPTSTAAERVEREEIRKQWALGIRKQQAAQRASMRRDRVRYYFQRQAENNAAIARGLNSLQPRQYYYVP